MSEIPPEQIDEYLTSKSKSLGEDSLEVAIVRQLVKANIEAYNSGISDAAKYVKTCPVTYVPQGDDGLHTRLKNHSELSDHILSMKKKSR